MLFLINTKKKTEINRSLIIQWLGRKDSNLRCQDQNLVPYRLATPQQIFLLLSQLFLEFSHLLVHLTNLQMVQCVPYSCIQR